MAYMVLDISLGMLRFWYTGLPRITQIT